MKTWLDALGPMAISGSGILLIFLGGLVAKWRNRRVAQRLGGTVVSLAPTSYAPHPNRVADVKRHRR